MSLMEPPKGQEPELEPGEALTILLWVVAVLLGLLELVVFLAELMVRSWR